MGQHTGTEEDLCYLQICSFGGYLSFSDFVVVHIDLILLTEFRQDLGGGLSRLGICSLIGREDGVAETEVSVGLKIFIR